jgi:ATP-dependent RNA helicase RhlE
LPQVVNFELPNVPEDYVHRIGRTGRAGSSGAAVSLVDREELKFLKDIEKLIKREIPKVQVEGFTPSDKPEPEAPRSTQNHGRPPRGHGQGQQQRKPQGEGGNRNSQNAGRNANQNQGQNRGQNNSQQARPPQGTSGQLMSEAARHQAMPQTPLFAPKPAPRNPNNRNSNNRNPNQNAFGKPNSNPNSTHRSGGRGR